MDYLDFHLKIGPRVAESQYTVSARSESLGETSGVFTRPLTDEQLELFVLKVGLARRGIRRIHSPEWRAAQDFGQKLFRALFTEDVRATYLASYNEALRQGKGLRIQLTLDAPELANYPWEFLYDPSSSQFLSLFEDTPILRYIELSRPILPLTVTPPLRILAVASSPKDFEPLDLGRERRNLSAALDPLIQAGMFELDWLDVATLEAVRGKLLKQPYHIFHFIGHGGFDEREQDGVLIFENAGGYSNRVSGERLAIILGNHRTLRLAILNACEGARTSEQDPFAGAATTLVRTGNMPAVIAMQFEISDNAAIDFASGFYSAIAAGRPVDASVSQGRQAIFASNNDVEWSTPVLYLRASDGVIFNVDTTRVAQEAARLAAEKAEQDRVVQEKLEAERLAAAKAEQERIAREQQAAAALAAAAQAEQERIAREKQQAEQERIAREKQAAAQAELERVAREKQEAAQAELERLAREKQQAAQADQERLARQQAEAASRAAAEIALHAHLAREKQDAERAAAVQAEQDRLTREKLEADRAAQRRLTYEKIQAQRLVAEQTENEQREKARQEMQRQERAKADAVPPTTKPSPVPAAKPSPAPQAKSVAAVPAAKSSASAATSSAPAATPQLLVAYLLTAAFLALSTAATGGAALASEYARGDDRGFPIASLILTAGALGAGYVGIMFLSKALTPHLNLKTTAYWVMQGGWLLSVLIAINAPHDIYGAINGDDSSFLILYYFLLGALTGGCIAGALWLSNPRFGRNILLIIAGGWVVGFLMEGLAWSSQLPSLQHIWEWLYPIKDALGYGPVSVIQYTILGVFLGLLVPLVGLAVMYWQLSTHPQPQS